MIKYLRKVKYVLNVMRSNESLFLPNCLDAKCTIYIIHTYILLFSQNKKGVIMQTIQPMKTAIRNTRYTENVSQVNIFQNFRLNKKITRLQRRLNLKSLNSSNMACVHVKEFQSYQDFSIKVTIKN